MTYSDIHFGKIIHLDMPKKEGIIKNLNHQELPFRFAAVREEVAKGNLVGFQLSPSKNFKSRYEAWNIQRAYLSKDKRPILDRRDSHLHLGVQPYLKTACAQIICEKKKLIKVQVNFKTVISSKQNVVNSIFRIKDNPLLKINLTILMLDQSVRNLQN